ncbi:MAG: hypothetical protein Q9188_002526 [Gyalolechia gomerana]
MTHKRRRTESGMSATKHRQIPSAKPVSRTKSADQYVYLAIYEMYGPYMETLQFICEVYASVLDANRRLRAHQGEERVEYGTEYDQWEDRYDEFGCWHSVLEEGKRYERYHVKRLVLNPPGTLPPPPPVNNFQEHLAYETHVSGASTSEAENPDPTAPDNVLHKNSQPTIPDTIKLKGISPGGSHSLARITKSGARIYYANQKAFAMDAGKFDEV